MYKGFPLCLPFLRSLHKLLSIFNIAMLLYVNFSFYQELKFKREFSVNFITSSKQFFVLSCYHFFMTKRNYFYRHISEVLKVYNQPLEYQYDSHIYLWNVVELNF